MRAGQARAHARRTGREAGAGDAPPIALWVVPVAELAGVARHVLDVAEHGVPGWRVVVLCPAGPLADRLREQGSAVLVGAVGPGDGPARVIREVRAVLRALGPDLVHSHLAFADLVCAAAATGMRSARGRRIRCVSTEHGISGIDGWFQRSGRAARARRAAHRARLQRTDAVIAVSESTREQIRRQWGGGAPVTVIRHGIRPPASAPAPRPGLRVLSLSRLAPEKRIEALLEAFALVVAEHPAARLTVAGIGEDEERLRSRARDLGLAGHVAFPGHLQAGPALAAHDVVAQLSVWENLSYTLLDAAAAGLGVVATAVGGNGEILPADCLVPPDAPARTVARAIVTQGLEPAARPRPSARPVAEMCCGIGEVYREAMA